MPTTKEDLRAWMERGQKQGYKYMLVFSDWFDYEDYPIFAVDGLDAVHKKEEELKTGNRFMEAYCFFEDVEAQLMESRANHMPQE